MRRFALAALIVMASSTLVHAQAYDRPKRTVGDTWSYTNGQVVKVVKVSEDGEVQVRSRPCATCQWVSGQGWHSPASPDGGRQTCRP